MQLHDLMGWPGPMTHRQWKAWQGWLALEMDTPSRSDHYLMQLSSEVCKLPARVWGKDAPGVKAEHFRLRFVRGEGGEKDRQPAAPKLTREQMAEVAKQAWAARLGINPDGTDKEVPPTQEDRLQSEIARVIREDRARRERTA